MIINQTPYPISFEREMSQALTCRYGEEMRQYIFKPDINVSGLSCLLQITKPDGTFTENGVEVHTDPDTGECTLMITIPQQATVVKGLAKYSICCYGEVETETHLLYSAEGPLWVDDDLITEEMIQSVAEVNGYVFPHEWAAIDMPYPGYGPSDAGKSLTVNADGTGVEWKSTEQVYTTNEQIVGTWIDGSSVYERVIEYATPFTIANDTWYTSTESYPGINRVINAWVINTDGATYNGIIVLIQNDKLVIGNQTKSQPINNLKYVILRYTKTA